MQWSHPFLPFLRERAMLHSIYQTQFIHLMGHKLGLREILLIFFLNRGPANNSLLAIKRYQGLNFIVSLLNSPQGGGAKGSPPWQTGIKGMLAEVFRAHQGREIKSKSNKPSGSKGGSWELKGPVENMDFREAQKNSKKLQRNLHPKYLPEYWPGEFRRNLYRQQKELLEDEREWYPVFT